jgi:inosose dehydratase
MRLKPYSMTRRELIFSTAAATTAPAAPSTSQLFVTSQLSVEAYIFQQYAQRARKPLGEVLAEVIPMARAAGFHNVELNQAFFTPELRPRTIALLHANRLRMPSVYVGGAMHETAAAEKTIALALEIAELCRPFGCTAVVNNPNPKAGGIEKTDAELSLQAELINRLGATLKARGFELRIHNHTPEIVSNAREFRSTLHNTDPASVSICLDLDWVYQGGMDPHDLLREAGPRVKEIHVRSSKDKLWLESFGEGDVDYRRIATEMKQAEQHPLIVVELAWRDNTAITRSLTQNLTLGRKYAEKIFGVTA